MKNKNQKHYITIIISLLFIFCFRFVPALPGLSASAMQVLGVFIGVLILWLRVSISWPSVLLIAALGFVPELKFSQILSVSYGGSTFVFLMFTFALTYALSQTSYIKRIAIGFITSNFAQKGAWQFITLYCASILFIGMFVSPTVLFFVYLPIVEEIYVILGLKKGDKFAATLMMATVIMCGISSGMTPISHVFPILALNAYEAATQTAISYAYFMGIGIPCGILTAILTILTFRFILRPDTSAFAKFNPEAFKKEQKPVTRDEKTVLAVFIIVVLLWVVPGMISGLLPDGFFKTAISTISGLGTAFPPIAGLVTLCILLGENGKPLLNFAEAFSKGISWPAVIMCAGTAALGSALTNADIGITAWLSNGMSPVLSNLPVLGMIFIFCFWAALQTNLSSNNVTATVVSTAAVAITLSMDSVNTMGLVVLIGMMSAYAFATPPAMPCVAVAGSSGWTNTTQMMKYGFIAMLISVAIFTLIGYPISLALL